MPIYEYEAFDPSPECTLCARRFEVFQGVNDSPLLACPTCSKAVRKLVSRFRAVAVARSEEATRVETQVKAYEREGMWSHAAELADKHAEKAGDSALRQRAYDDYQKAGYPVDRLVSSSAE